MSSLFTRFSPKTHTAHLCSLRYSMMWNGQRREQSEELQNICCLGYCKWLVNSHQTYISSLLPLSKCKHMSDVEMDKCNILDYWNYRQSYSACCVLQNSRFTALNNLQCALMFNTVMLYFTHKCTHHEEYYPAYENSCLTSSVTLEGDFQSLKKNNPDDIIRVISV